MWQIFLIFTETVFNLKPSVWSGYELAYLDAYVQQLTFTIWEIWWSSCSKTSKLILMQFNFHFTYLFLGISCLADFNESYGLVQVNAVCGVSVGV